MSQQGTFASGNPAAAVLTLTGDTGGPVSPTAGNINIDGDGVNIDTVGHPATSTINVVLRNTILLPNTNSAGTEGILYLGASRSSSTTFLHNYGTSNTFVGQAAGNLTLTVADSVDNVGIGTGALISIVSSQTNTAVGVSCLGSLSTSATPSGGGIGGSNTCVGDSSLFFLTTGNCNDCLGINTGSSGLNGLTTGSFNILIGGGSSIFTGVDAAGKNYTSSESSNICIRNIGVTGESNTIRIGTSGSGDAQQNRCFIAGIQGVTPSIAGAKLTIINTQGQLGSLGTATNGQLPIGSTGANPVLATLTAGTNISITNAAGSITIAGSGTPLVPTYTNVNSTPYTVTINDYYLSVDTSTLAITIQLPNAPTTNRTFVIKDRTGAAATRNISVTTLGGSVTIDGVTTFTMNTNFQAINLVFNGTSYEAY